MVLNPIRLNWHYVIWYRNFTLLIVSLIVPFVLLAYWNFNTLSVLLRRRRLRNRRPPSIESTPRDTQFSTISNSASPITPLMAAATLNSGAMLPQTITNSTSDQGTKFAILLQY